MLQLIGILVALVLFVTWMGARAARLRDIESPHCSQKQNTQSSGADDWTEGDEPPEAA